jgi:acyl carrier protein
MTEQEVYAVLTEVFHEVFMRDTIILKPEMTAFDVPGWDSYAHVELLLVVEEKFQITLSSKEIASLKFVGDMADLILKKISAR